MSGIYWRGMKRQIQQYVEVCQQQKYSSMSPVGLLQPLLILDQIWDDVDGLHWRITYIRRNGTVVVVVDQLSKHYHFVAMRHPFTAQMVAAALVKVV